MSDTYQMDSHMESQYTQVVEGHGIKAYCTSDSVKICLFSQEMEAEIWVTRDQALELIDILSLIVNSKPKEPEEAFPVGIPEVKK